MSNGSDAKAATTPAMAEEASRLDVLLKPPRCGANASLSWSDVASMDALSAMARATVGVLPRHSASTPSSRTVRTTASTTPL